VAAENARFSYPEARLGFTGGLIAGLAARIPYKVAMEMMLLCRILDPQRAYMIGLVNEVVPTGQQVPVALKMAREMTEFSPLVLKTLKRFVTEGVLAQSSAIAAAIHSSSFWWDTSCLAFAVFKASRSGFDAPSGNRKFSGKRTRFGFISVPRNTGYKFSGTHHDAKFSPPIAAEMCRKKDNANFGARRDVTLRHSNIRRGSKCRTRSIRKAGRASAKCSRCL
jgi:hypothetical protein